MPGVGEPVQWKSHLQKTKESLAETQLAANSVFLTNTSFIHIRFLFYSLVSKNLVNTLKLWEFILLSVHLLGLNDALI